MLLIILGLTLLILVQMDFVVTALSSGHHGPFTRRLSLGCWHLLQALQGRIGGRFLHSYSGLIVLTVVTLTWLLLTTLAWLLIFGGASSSLVMRSTDEPANWLQTLSFVGSALSTMGAANASPVNGWWGIWGAVAAANGFVLLTLSVTYILTVMQTVAAGRSFALLVNSLDPADKSYTTTYAENLAQLVSQLTSVPMALYYSSSRRDLRLTLAISRFATVVARSPDLWPIYLPSFQALPGLTTAGDEVTLEEVTGWAARYSLTRESAPQ
ncbi:MAG: hypothetical protein ACK4QP_10110 [Pseudorhizobium sp.]